MERVRDPPATVEPPPDRRGLHGVRGVETPLHGRAPAPGVEGCDLGEGPAGAPGLCRFRAARTEGESSLRGLR
ncbi:predicted protein [Streptomyces viridosporus ATCC 14672]|uniref:Predicted protein n=1 Tax=Streptomyces viridosporus (strain ATCC 14672 / DSM 40746 / JCM 4963 / KCTC 9882 / NRRL B-12104 / FH 1290) TaxID=566461 RepID=D6A3L4_STRV1|nr:predicted protein [Streptomyces viridosporus ATCC 14672]